MATTTHLRERLQRPRALALLDVLIGMALFALIAVIAVLTIGQLRSNAHETQTIEDARTLGIALSAGQVLSGAGLDTLPPAPTQGTGADIRRIYLGTDHVTTLTPGNRLADAAYVPATAGTPAHYRICIEHYDNGSSDPADGGTVTASASYETYDGGILASDHTSTSVC